MDGDASWDEDFEFASADSGLSIPQALSAVSGRVQDEGVAARKVAKVIGDLRSTLQEDDERLASLDEPEAVAIVQQAVALVHASITEEDDSFYGSKVWQRYKHSDLAVAATTFEQVLESAEACQSKLTFLIKPKPS